VTNRIVIIEHDLRALMELAVAFRGTPYEITAVESAEPINAATRHAEERPAAMIVALGGNENVAGMRSLLAASTGTRMLFLVPRMPTSPALARIVREAGGVVLWAREAPIVVVATLITILTREHGAVS